MNNTKPFQFRAVQLDLARQMETLDFIFEFIDFIEKSGYNTLVLYLEGRIKTKSFPYPRKGEFYTPAEMRKVVAFARKKKIDVVPVVSILGHAELFLKHKEIAHFAEIRGNEGERPLEESINHVFCLSSPEVIDFIKIYLSEIADIFPSKYLHLGCDEAWDLGCCPLCRERIRKGETLTDLFVKHLVTIHDFVKKVLHKEVIIWDDLFECYEGSLEMMPRDIILCCWQYDRCINLPKAHFKCRLEEDLLAIYEKMGFRYIFGPSTYYAGNIESLTEYTSKHKPLGGLLTVWEKSLNFMYEVLPMVHYAGKIWSGKNTDFDDSMKEIFGCGDRLFLNTLRSYYEIRLTHPTRLSLDSYLTGPLTELEAVTKTSCKVNSDVFRIYLDKCKDKNAKNMIEDMLVSLEWKKIMFNLRSVVEELYTFGKKRLNITKRKQITRNTAKTVDDFLNMKLSQWKRFRPGISSAKIKKTFSKFRKDIVELAEKSAKAVGVLEVKFFLPDQYNAQKCSFEIEFSDGSKEKVADGIYKNYELHDAYFYYKFPYYSKKKPIVVRIESWLFGGQGFAYLKIISDKGDFVPASINDINGIVQSPQHLLINDLRYCFFGETDMEALFQMPELAHRKHGVTLKLTNA